LKVRDVFPPLLSSPPLVCPFPPLRSSPSWIIEGTNTVCAIRVYLTGFFSLPPLFFFFSPSFPFECISTKTDQDPRGSIVLKRTPPFLPPPTPSTCPGDFISSRTARMPNGMSRAGPAPPFLPDHSASPSEFRAAGDQDSRELFFLLFLPPFSRMVLFLAPSLLIESEPTL